MAKDIYNIDTPNGDAWQLDGPVINIEDAESLIINSAALNYSRGSTKFSPLNQRKRYLVTGEANGRITLGLIVGPSRDLKAFLQRYADACQVKKNVMSIQPAGIKECENDSEPIQFICNGVFMDNIALQIQQVGQALTMVGAGLGFSFIGLQLK